MKIAEGAQLARLIENSEIAERVFKTIDALETSDLTAAERIRRIYHAALTTSNAAVRNGVEKGSRVIRSRTAQVLVRLTSTTMVDRCYVSQADYRRIQSMTSSLDCLSC